MAYSLSHELEYMVDDYYGASDFDDNPFEDSSDSLRSSSVDDSQDSDFDDDFEMVITEENMRF